MYADLADGTQQQLWKVNPLPENPTRSALALDRATIPTSSLPCYRRCCISHLAQQAFRYL